MSQPSTEREDLDHLTGHPGWLRLKAWAESEWTKRIADLTAKAANQTDDLLALQQLRQVLAAQAAVQLVIGWPEDQLRRIAAQSARTETPMTPNRRGGL